VHVMRVMNFRVKWFILSCRDLGTLQSVSAAEYVSSILSIAALVVKQLSSEIFGNINPLRSYLQHAFCYLECLYDPYCTWRISLRGYVTLYMCTHSNCSFDVFIKFKDFCYILRQLQQAKAI